MRSLCRSRRAMRRALATLLLALLASVPVVAAVATAAADQDRRDSQAVRHHRGAARIHFVGVNRRGQERTGDHFSVQRLRDVVVVVHWRTLVGQHTQRLELISPDGAVYQTFRTAVESASGQTTVETSVPVAGSWITDYSLFGKWRVNVYLDENARPEGSDTFVLTR